MPYEHFVYLVDQAKDMGAELISVFGFGEPLLDGGIYKKIAYCTHRGLDTFITSNAAILTTTASKRLVGSGLTKIRFSMHGMYEDYESVHRGLTYRRFLHNVTNFLLVNGESKSHKIKTALTVIPQNDYGLKFIRDVWEKSFDEFEVWSPHNWTSGRNYRELGGKTKKTCGRPFRGPVQIQADGMQIVCCFDFNGELEVGNTYKNTIEENLKGQVMHNIRMRHKNGIHYGYLCENCDQRNLSDNPLIYSNVDKERKSGCTSSTKFNLEEK
jgi:hypothetical protein